MSKHSNTIKFYFKSAFMAVRKQTWLKAAACCKACIHNKLRVKRKIGGCFDHQDHK